MTSSYGHAMTLNTKHPCPRALLPQLQLWQAPEARSVLDSSACEPRGRSSSVVRLRSGAGCNMAESPFGTGLPEPAPALQRGSCFLTSPLTVLRTQLLLHDVRRGDVRCWGTATSTISTSRGAALPASANLGSAPPARCSGFPSSHSIYGSVLNRSSAVAVCPIWRYSSSEIALRRLRFRNRGPEKAQLDLWHFARCGSSDEILGGTRSMSSILGKEAACRQLLGRQWESGQDQEGNGLSGQSL